MSETLSENQNPITESSGIVGIVNCRLPQEYWRDGDIGFLFNGKAEEVLPCIESESIDLTVTSPPYDNLRSYLFANAVVFRYIVTNEEKQNVIKELKAAGVKPKKAS
jgi:hypothetical protein